MLIDKIFEGWKDIPEYMGLYRVSDKGKIYSYKTNKVLSPWENNRGYLCIKLFKNNCRNEYKVHQLVMLAFSPEEKTTIKREVHHKNSIRTDNRLENLEWCSHKKNIQYKYEKKKELAEEGISDPF